MSLPTISLFNEQFLKWQNKYLWRIFLMFFITIVIYWIYLVNLLIKRKAKKRGNNTIYIWFCLVLNFIYNLVAIRFLLVSIVSYLLITSLLIDIYLYTQLLLGFLINISRGVMWLQHIFERIPNKKMIIIFPIPLAILFILAYMRSIIITTFEAYKYMFMTKKYRVVNISNCVDNRTIHIILVALIPLFLWHYESHIEETEIYGAKIFYGLLSTFLIHHIGIIMIDHNVEKDFRRNRSNLVFNKISILSSTILAICYYLFKTTKKYK